MEREKKIEEIVDFAEAIFELATEYSRMVSIRDQLSDSQIDELYCIATKADSLFGELAEHFGNQPQ